MRTVRPSTATTLKVVSVPLALLASGALVWQASSAAFTATTSNAGNSWAAGKVVLTDDDGGTESTSGTALFTAPALKPGSTGTKCIVVSSTSTVPATLKLYTTGVATTNALSSHLTLKVEQGTGGSFSSCTGFAATATLADTTLAALGTSATGFANGVLTTSLTGTPTETRSYRFTYTLNANTPDTAQNGTAAATFVWEAQSTA